MKLLSDTTFGRGDGVAGLIDQEVEHDPYGFPYLRGRTLKGLLSEECDNLIAVLLEPHLSRWQNVATQLFGCPGSVLDTIAKVHFGDACLPKPLREQIALQIDQSKTRRNNKLTKADVLSSLTSIRRQTAIDPASGAPAEHSLRSSRVILKNLCFTAFLQFEETPSPEMLALLAVGALALRRVGSGRNRGRGHVQCTLHETLNDTVGREITQDYLHYFQKKTTA
jgi:CRISPR/Cas system CSM-associated protein Csm3 (group 7 of RAMP superfamily)